ncbi:MAG TPA: hypothetical protein VLA66_06140 [Thermoanaerobaculia bacterium]|nr:hypothetical protein [Thermoanaerobaculia bacterium]
MLVLDLGLDGPGYLQTVAGAELWCDAELAPGARPAPRPAIEEPAGAEPEELVYDGPGIVAGRVERVRSWLSAEGWRTVEFASGDRFRVSPDGVSVALTAGSTAGAVRERRLELAVGAPLALALALRGVHLLHASAVAGSEGVVALCGDSGAGKSTLAAAALEQPGLGLRRVADDILPVRLGADPVALPHFPQLKLPRGRGYPQEAPPRLPLRGLVVLDRGGEEAPLALERLEPAAALAEVVRAGVATRLLDRALLARHFELCAEAASNLTVVRLRYPSGGASLPRALGALRSLAGGEIRG